MKNLKLKLKKYQILSLNNHLEKGFFVAKHYIELKAGKLGSHEASHVFVSKNAPYGLMAWQDCIPHPALNSF